MSRAAWWALYALLCALAFAVDRAKSAVEDRLLPKRDEPEKPATKPRGGRDAGHD